jgi:FemAB-related protein (PEP-CTERM system-associated)
MYIQEATDSIRWNKFVENHSEANCFHLYEWKYCFEKAYGLKTLYFEVCSDNDIVGILPLTLIGIKGMRYAISLPFCNYGGPLAVSKDIDDLLINEAKCMIKARCKGVKGIELRKIVTMGSQSGYVSLLRELPDRSEVLWKSLRTKERNQVRKAERSGLRICWGKVYLDEFYAVYTRNMHRLGTPAHSKRWLMSILDSMPARTDLITVFLDNLPVAGMLIFKFRDCIGVPYASTVKEFNSLCPNALMYWEALKHGSENSFKYFDFGRSIVGSSTYKFKKHWGGIPMPLSYEFISFGNVRKNTEMKYAGGKALLVAKLWSRIPYSLSLWLGPRIRMYIP